MEEHDTYERELVYDMGELRLALSSQRDSEDGQEDLSIGAPGGGGETVFPFQIVQIDATTIAIRKGTVSTIVPTIDETPLNGDYTLNTINVTGATTFWIDATLANEIVAAVAIVTSDPGADTDTQSKQTLGSLTWDSGAIDAISSNLGGSQNVDSCGDFHSWNRI